MENPPTSNDDATFPELQALHIPTEVCENIIDMLYSDRTEDTLQDIITLHSCAVVCRAWRVRSQKMLFYQVQLSDRPSFHKLAAILDTAPHLRDYVHEVRLTGYNLHTTSSIFASFLAVFAQKLPNLERIDVFHLLESSKIVNVKLDKSSACFLLAFAGLLGLVLCLFNFLVVDRKISLFRHDFRKINGESISVV